MGASSHQSRFLERISAMERRLRLPLPGWSSMQYLSPTGRGYVPVEDARRAGCREACTLILLYPWAGTAYTVLTLRSGELKDHAGQISLPGGATESGERTEECAYREAEEELGLDPEAPWTIGRLTPLYVAPSDFCVSPIVAAMASRPVFRPQVSEVHEVIEVPLSDLAKGTARRVETRRNRGEDRLVPYYGIETHKVWGATAMILSELVTVWTESEQLSGGRDE